MLYLDYYPEHADYLNLHFKHVEGQCSLVVVNMSVVSPDDKPPRIAIKPSIVQASCQIGLSIQEATAFATRLLETTSAERAFVTLGSRGAVLAKGIESWYMDTQIKLPKSLIGSGAIFSSNVIRGIAEGLDCAKLLEYAVSQTANRLQYMQHYDASMQRLETLPR